MEMDQSKLKKKRAPTALTIKCSVCGAAAPDHVHFGGHCCYSCRAFFRRTLQRMEKTEIVCRTGIGQCEVSEMSKACSACRYDKCLSVGMKSDLLQGKRKKKDGHQDDLTATSPPSSYTPKPNYMTSEPGEAQETDHNIESFDNKNILNSDFDNSVLKENPSEATPSKLELEQDRKRQFVIDYNNMCTDKKSFSNFPYKYPHTSSYSSPVNELRKVRRNSYIKAEELHDFQYQRANSFHGQITPKEEFNPEYYQQGVSQDPTVLKKEVIEHGATLDNIQHPSVIQGPSSGVIKSTRTSVIQHTHSLPKREELGEDLPADQSQGSAPHSSTFLRYGADVMKYQADFCKQQSKVLNIQASMIEQEERARQALMTPYYTQNNLYVPTMPSYPTRRQTPQGTGHMGHSHIRSNQNLHQHQGSNIRYENIPTNVLPSQGEGFVPREPMKPQEQPLESFDEKAEQINLQKDLESMFDEVLQKENSSLDSKVFQSQIFQEAEDLLSNSPLNNLLFSLSQDVKQQQQQQQRHFNENVPSEILVNDRALKMDRKKPCVDIQHVGRDDFDDNPGPEFSYKCGENQDPRRYNKISEFRITDEEINVVDKIYWNMSRCTKAMVRPAVYQAMIDCWRGVKTYHQMLGILAQGKSSQAYMHILIFANLPYFTEMSSRAHQYLMRVNGSVCQELMTAYFFFGHNATTILEQEKTCGLVSNFTDYIMKEAPYAANMPARSYDSIYQHPWAASYEDEQKHKRTQQLVGESMRGKDKRVLPILYALAFYAVTDVEMTQAELSVQDKAAINKAKEHLSVIYRRFMKQEHGWMAGAGYAISHVYYITVMKENVKIGHQSPVHKQVTVQPEKLKEADPMPIPPGIVRPIEILKDIVPAKILISSEKSQAEMQPQ